MKESIINWIRGFYMTTSHGEAIFNQKAYDHQALLWTVGMFLAMVIVTFILWFISRILMVKLLSAIIDRSSVTWDDHLIENKVFPTAAYLVPLFFLQDFLSLAFYHYPEMDVHWIKLAHTVFSIVAMITIRRVLNSLRDFVNEQDRYKDKPIQSYFQAIKITVSGVFVILILSFLLDRSPLFFLTSLGAMAAVLIVVFRDSILGFVASVQIAVNDIIRIGDWITMEKFGADGNVIEINVSTVKVQNFDKTITTIPTYSMISDSFKNWRGMKESKGRRIKRPVYIQIDSVEFASEELIKKLKEIKLMKEYIDEREDEIRKHNEEFGVHDEDYLNGRRQTNIGLFRKYVELYIRNKPEINSELEVVVRQLAPTELGVPMEIYCFTYTKEWEEFEEIQADIFDHVFAITHVFELHIFENPTGRDFNKMLNV